MRALPLSRGVAALAVLALAAGGTLAASPSPSPAESAGSSASPSAASSAAPSVEASAASSSPSPAPAAASEAPVRSDTARESEPVEKDDLTEKDDPAEKAETPDSPPSAAEVTDFVGRLKAAGISTTDAAFAALAAKVGVGGAVRTLAFANASGKTPDQIVTMFQGGKGWGQIKHELNLSIGPGIGWIMGGGHGHAKGPKSK